MTGPRVVAHRKHLWWLLAEAAQAGRRCRRGSSATRAAPAMDRPIQTGTERMGATSAR
jgi:hypothetical protein